MQSNYVIHNDKKKIAHRPLRVSKSFNFDGTSRGLFSSSSSIYFSKQHITTKNQTSA